ncbi:MAG: cation diffusion facilitator family transporter [Lachnospiraceae bacterium]|nr:cation diffusion facilitator family transporter [Lachnospiraceae bacterium]
MAKTKQVSEREKIVVRTSTIGIIANIFLAVFKAMIGALSNSIAITLDAVNNLSDALSSVITIVGTKLAGKRPDKKHPMGHGRVEYLTAAIISLIVLYAGATSLIESIKKILHPETPDYTTVSLVIVAVAVLVKIVLGRYVKGVGEKINSESLIDSGTDATMDAVISASTLVAAGIYLGFGIKLEAVLGAIISIVIIKSGIEMLSNTISQILGERVDSALAIKIKRMVSAFPEVHGAYDLVTHSYGPDMLLASIHVEVDDTMNAAQIDELERRIADKVYEELNVVMTAIGIYSANTSNDKALKLKSELTKLVMSFEYVIQMHGFYYNEEDHFVSFDAVVDFDAPDRNGVQESIYEAVQAQYPELNFVIKMDDDVSE